MKPIKIVMSAFGSYAGREEISFSGTNQGIFLITGDTGAGKTTIFDAITYALYGFTSGNRRTGKMMGSQFAASKAKTYVEYTFEEEGKIYTVSRRPDIAGQTGKVELILPDGTVFPGKVKETNKKLEEIVGLDMDQFCQVAMIAQGDFRELLLASSNDRKAIFEKIFGTDCYNQVQIHLNEYCKKLYGKRADLQKFSERELAGVQVPADSTFTEQWEQQKKAGISEISNEELFTFLEKLIEEEQLQEKQFAEEKDGLEQQIRQIHGQITAGKAVNELFERLQLAKQSAEDLLAQKEEFESLGERCRAARSALLVDDKAKQVSESNTQFQNLTAEMKQLELDMDRLKQQKEQADAQQQEALSQREKKMPGLQQEKAALETSMEYYEQLHLKKKELERQSGEQVKLQKQDAQLKIKIEERNALLEQARNVQETYEGCQEFYYQTRDSYVKIVDKKKELTRICGKKDLWKQLQGISVKEKKQMKQLLAQYEQAVTSYQQAYHAFIAEQAGLLAADLKEHQPCPVCGSLTHPKKAALSEHAVTQQETEQKKQVMDCLEQRLNQQKDICQEKDRELVAFQVELKTALQSLEIAFNEPEGIYEISKSYETSGTHKMNESYEINETFWENLESLLADWRKECLCVEKSLKQAEKQKKQYEEAQKQQKKLESENQADLDMQAALEQKLEQQNIVCVKLQTQIQGQQNQLKYENKQIAQQHLDMVQCQIQKLEQNLVRAQQNQVQITNKLQEISGRYQAQSEQKLQVKVQLSQAYELFSSSLKEHGFADKQSYLNSRMKPEQIRKLEKDCDEYHQRCTRMQSEVETYTRQLDGKTREDLTGLQKQEQHLQKQRQEKEEQEKTLFSILANNKKRLSVLRKLLKDYEQVKEEYNVVYHLNRTANGKLDLKLDFQTYMLRRYFEEIIYEANKRLRIMTRDQFILQCRSYENFSGNAAAGLDLDVYSLITGKTRDVKTLSGGESFMAALAMALGMADMIQSRAGKVHLDTMFIDEGFGSLDDQSREDAIRVLNELAGQKRLIGIISHVTELKEQIEQKLIVTRDEKGSHAHWDC